MDSVPDIPYQEVELGRDASDIGEKSIVFDWLVADENCFSMGLEVKLYRTLIPRSGMKIIKTKRCKASSEAQHLQGNKRKNRDTRTRVEGEKLE